jgi:predicted amidohydrolase
MAALEEPVRVACIQTKPVFGDPDRNRRTTVELIARACAEGSRIIVLPELCISGYAFRSHKEALSLSEPLDGPTAKIWSEAAARGNAYVIGGICERAGDGLFNSAILVGPGGRIGRYRKVHLWNSEKRHFRAGNLGFPVVETPLGRIAMLICYDMWFPEAIRSCALNGADIVCVPTAWTAIPGQDPHRDAIHNILIMAAAHSNSLPVLCAARVGRENGLSFIGQSVIAAHSGWPAAGPASAENEQILSADIYPQAARRARRWSDVNDLVGDRRPDQYVV